MGFIFVPLYISYLGVEAYGLIGLFATLQAWLTILDMGLAPTLGREMARWQGGAHTPQGIRDLLRSIELVYVTVSVAIAAIICFGADWLARHWLNAEALSVGTLSSALSITGLVIAFRWIGGLYRSALLGLQEQVWLNASIVIFATLRGAGVIVVLAKVSPTIEAFFAYQGVVAALEALVLCLMLYWFLPVADRPGTFSLPALRAVGRYTAGIAGITFLSLLLTQVDKVLLSGLLPLSEFGYYALAGTVAGALYVFVGPIAAAIGPKLVELVARGPEADVAKAYHRYAQLMSLSIIPPAMTIALFSDRLLLLWTHNPEITAAAAPIVSLLVMGTMFNGVMSVPYLLQLASGWTQFSLVTNTIAVAILLPALVLVVPVYGPTGAATVWLVLNVSYVVLALPFMHRRLLSGQLTQWYVSDVGGPLLCVSLLAGVVRLATSGIPLASSGGNALTLAAAAILTPAGAVMAVPLGRDFLRSRTSIARAWMLGRRGPR